MDTDVGIGGGAMIDCRIGLFLDGGDDDGKAFGARRVQEEKREAAIAGESGRVGSGSSFRSHYRDVESGVCRDAGEGFPFCMGGSKSHCATSS